MAIVITNDDSSLNIPAGSQTVPGPLTVSTGGITLSDPITGVFKERGRATAMGEWTAFVPTLTANAGTFSGTTTTSKYFIVGKTLTVAFALDSCSVSATPTELYIAIPGGFVGAGRYDNAVNIVLDNGVAVANCGVKVNANGATVLTIFKLSNAVWATTVGNSLFHGQLTFEVQ